MRLTSGRRATSNILLAVLVNMTHYLEYIKDWLVSCLFKTNCNFKITQVLILISHLILCTYQGGSLSKCCFAWKSNTRWVWWMRVGKSRTSISFFLGSLSVIKIFIGLRWKFKVKHKWRTHQKPCSKLSWVISKTKATFWMLNKWPWTILTSRYT